MVEPPGIAPGSGSLITRAFIAIVRANPDTGNIGAIRRVLKGLATRAGGSEVVLHPAAPVVQFLERLFAQVIPLATGLTDALRTV